MSFYRTLNIFLLVFCYFNISCTSVSNEDKNIEFSELTTPINKLKTKNDTSEWALNDVIATAKKLQSSPERIDSIRMLREYMTKEGANPLLLIERDGGEWTGYYAILITTKGGIFQKTNGEKKPYRRMAT